MMNISTDDYNELIQKDMIQCPINPKHELSTNFSGERVCTSCSKRLSELKKEETNASRRISF